MCGFSLAVVNQNAVDICRYVWFHSGSREAAGAFTPPVSFPT